MKAAAALVAVLFWQMTPRNEPPVARPDAMRYERAIQVPAGAGQACAVLDAQIFPHAAPSLTDVRIFPEGGEGHEVPYAITMSEAVSEETEPTRLLNLGVVDGKIVFDLEMPNRPYTGVTLDLDPEVHDFIATATVIGTNVLGPGGARDKSVDLGTFTLFDLASQHLSRDTTLPLEESTFHYLHIVLNVSPAPGNSPSARFGPAMVRGASVPPSRAAQTLYTTVAETTAVATVGRESVAKFEVPARVPVERVSVELTPGFKGNFSRDMRVTATAEAAAKGADEDGRAPLPETVTGNILRVHTYEAGREIRTEELGVPAVLGANLQRAAKVELAIENGDDQPLPIASMLLEMRQRKICFDAAGASGGLVLMYGDSRLLAPVYDYERLFAASRKPLVAELGPEQLNPNYHPPADSRPFTERHPEVLWIALIATICVLGMVAMRSARNMRV
jgi:hypothetical protein